jgi:4-hydroxy-tetrahydrodipicolinate synthase
VTPEPVFKGVAVALVTLFDDYLDVDAEGTAGLAAQLVELGVKAVVVAGSTGEAAALDPEERSSLLVAVRKTVPQGCGVPVIAGTGAPSARQAAWLTATARDEGADAVLALSPPGTANPRRYYDEVAEAAKGVPVLAYHYPSVSAPGIPLAALADLPVDGMKDSSGDPGRLLETLDTWDRPVYPGNSALVTLAGALGCPGAILALANAEPEVCALAFAGDAEAQLKLARPRRLTEGRFPMGLKELVAKRFGCSTKARLG